MQETKINARKTVVWQSSTHRKCQSEEVNLHKTDEKPKKRDAKQKRCQKGGVPNSRDVWRKVDGATCK